MASGEVHEIENKCSCAYICYFEPPVGDGEEDSAQNGGRYDNVTWTNKELVDKIRAICPRCGLLDWIIYKLFGKG